MFLFISSISSPILYCPSFHSHPLLFTSPKLVQPVVLKKTVIEFLNLVSQRKFCVFQMFFSTGVSFATALPMGIVQLSNFFFQLISWLMLLFSCPLFYMCTSVSECQYTFDSSWHKNILKPLCSTVTSAQKMFHDIGWSFFNMSICLWVNSWRQRDWVC